MPILPSHNPGSSAPTSTPKPRHNKPSPSHPKKYSNLPRSCNLRQRVSSKTAMSTISESAKPPSPPITLTTKSQFKGFPMPAHTLFPKTPSPETCFPKPNSPLSIPPITTTTIIYYKVYSIPQIMEEIRGWLPTISWAVMSVPASLTLTYSPISTTPLMLKVIESPNKKFIINRRGLM